MKFMRILPPAILILAAAWAANTLTGTINLHLHASTDILTAIDAGANALTHLPWRLYLTSTAVFASLLAALATLAAYFSYMWRRPRRLGEEHGSARWATHNDLAAYANKNHANNLLFTRHAALSFNTHTTYRNLNAYILGGSGAGKTRSYVLPNIFQASCNYVITDPKGEIYRATRVHLENNGYTTYALNLVDLATSDTYNPLALINPTSPAVDIAILVDNIITNTTGTNKNSTDGFWEKAERALLTGLIAYTWATEENPTFAHVLDLLAQMSASERGENTPTSPTDRLFTAAQSLIKDYKHTDTSTLNPTIVTALDTLTFATSQYHTYTQGAGETRKSVIISLGVRLAPLHMPALARILTGNSLNIDTLSQGKVACYLILPDTHTTFTFLTSIFYQQLFDRLIYLADHTPGGSLTSPVHCFMDEFANIGRLPTFERKIAVMRSRGISVSIICQNNAQGKALYKDQWETIIGNCDSLLFLGGQEKSTTELISKMLGKQTIAHTEYSQSRGTTGSSSQAERLLARDLATPDELSRLPTSAAIYMLRGLPPLKDTKLAPPQGV